MIDFSEVNDLGGRLLEDDATEIAIKSSWVENRFWLLQRLANRYYTVLLLDSLCCIMLILYILTMIHFSKGISLFLEVMYRVKETLVLELVLSQLLLL